MSTTIREVADRIEETFDLTTEAARTTACTYWAQIQDIDGHPVTQDVSLDQEVTDEDADFIIESTRQELEAEGL